MAQWVFQILLDPLIEEFRVLEGIYILRFFFFFLFNPIVGFIIVINGIIAFPFSPPKCRGNQPAIITSTTVEVVVPRSLVPIIQGEDGACLKQIRQVHSVLSP